MREAHDFVKFSWLAYSEGWREYASYRDSGQWTILQKKQPDALCDMRPDNGHGGAFEHNEAKPDFGGFKLPAASDAMDEPTASPVPELNLILQIPVALRGSVDQLRIIVSRVEDSARALAGADEDLLADIGARERGRLANCADDLARLLRELAVDLAVLQGKSSQSALDRCARSLI